MNICKEGGEPKIEVGVFHRRKLLAKHTATKSKNAGKYAAVRALKMLRNKSAFLENLRPYANTSLILQTIFE